MDREILVSLLNNATLLLSLGIIYDLVGHLPLKFGKYFNWILGLIIGLIGMILMSHPFVLSEGLVFDTRTILVSVTAYFFGPVPTLVTVLLTGLYRLSLGGIGVLPGIATIVSSAVIGLLWRHLNHKSDLAYSWLSFYSLGILVNFMMPVCWLLLPYPTNLSTIGRIALPVITIYPVVTVFLGLILVRRLQYDRLMKQKLEVEAKYQLLFEHSTIAKLLIDPETGRIIDSNPAASELYGWSGSELKQMTIFDINELEPKAIQLNMKKAEQSERKVFQFKHRLADGSRREVEVYAGPIVIDGKKLLYSIIHDVSQRKQMEREIFQRTKALQDSMQSVVIMLSSVIDLRDPFTAGHQRRVGNLAADIARKLNKDSLYIEKIRTVGYLHDIGKLAIPTDILSKPGVLSKLELELVRTHVEQGSKMLSQVKLPGSIAEIVLQHHERIDGSGYPRGLQGSAILEEAAILAVADVVESMLSHRPYRRAHSLEVALTEIRDNQQTHYRPDIVIACCSLFEEDSYQLDDQEYNIAFPINLDKP